MVPRFQDISIKRKLTAIIMIAGTVALLRRVRFSGLCPAKCVSGKWPPAVRRLRVFPLMISGKPPESRLFSKLKPGGLKNPDAAHHGRRWLFWRRSAQAKSKNTKGKNNMKNITVKYGVDSIN
jgi:hypothetical protein